LYFRQQTVVFFIFFHPRPTFHAYNAITNIGQNPQKNRNIPFPPPEGPLRTSRPESSNSLVHNAMTVRTAKIAPAVQ